MRDALRDFSRGDDDAFVWCRRGPSAGDGLHPVHRWVPGRAAPLEIVGATSDMCSSQMQVRPADNASTLTSGPVELEERKVADVHWVDARRRPKRRIEVLSSLLLPLSSSGNESGDDDEIELVGPRLRMWPNS
jgi:hypothetical protein